MEVTGKLKEIDTFNGALSLQINEKQTLLVNAIELLSSDKLTIKISKYRQKRSLDANAYCWVLIGKLSEKLNIPKEEIYRNAIKQIGGNSDIVCVKSEAVEKLCKGWHSNGLGWQTDTFKSKLKGCTNVILYYGSSTYDTKQMSLLINNIVDECKIQDIETRTPNEIAELLTLWEGNNGKVNNTTH